MQRPTVPRTRRGLGPTDPDLLEEDDVHDRPTLEFQQGERGSPDEEAGPGSTPPDIRIGADNVDWLLGEALAMDGPDSEPEPSSVQIPPPPPRRKRPSVEVRPSPAAEKPDPPPLTRPVVTRDYADPQSLVGAVIAERYRIVGLAGGMGTVYLGEHLLLRAPVAIKLLAPEARNLPELVERFRREALVGAHVRHTNIAAATDFGQEADGSYYLVFEFVEGMTLESELGAGPIEPTRAATIAARIADGLAALHDRGVVHRDLKPTSILLLKPRTVGQRSDEVKLTDFGFAKLDSSLVGGEDQASDERITRAGTVVGTLPYMAPEAALGMDAVDARSDLYALGVVLFRMLSGRHPFTWQDEGELLRKNLEEIPPSVRQSAPAQAIPAELEAVVVKLLAKQPDRRFQSAAEVSQALWALAGPQPDSVLLPPSPDPKSLPPSSADHAALVGSAALSEASYVEETVTTSSTAPLAAPVSEMPPAGWARPRRWPWVLGSAAGLVGAVLWASYGALSTPPSPAVDPSPAQPAAAPPEPQSPASSAITQPQATSARALTATERDQLRRRFLGLMGSAKWTAAYPSFVELVRRDPEFFSSKRGQTAAMNLLDMVSRLPTAAAAEAVRLLTYEAGAGGLDVLLEIALHRGGSASHARVVQAITDPSLISRAPAELKPALELYSAGCKAPAELYQRSAAQGDSRVFLVFLSQRDRCPKNEIRDQAFNRLQRRLQDQHRQ